VLKLELEPIDQHIDQIEKWLSQEWIDSEEGFLADWDMIPEAYEEKRLCVLTDNELAIGFVVYRIYDELGVIDIAEIKPSNRKKGIGQKFMLDILEFFKEQGVLVVKLFCAPKVSEGFWGKCGFRRFIIPNSNRINMYKILVPAIEPSTDNQSNEILELWDCEPHKADKVEPKWRWNLEYQTDGITLIKPIIFPAYYEWQLALRIKNEQVMKRKVKYFPLDLSNNETFIILREIIDRKKH
jgi:GNAT superfamily N-acetyltransferase